MCLAAAKANPIFLIGKFHTTLTEMKILSSAQKRELYGECYDRRRSFKTYSFIMKVHLGTSCFCVQSALG